MHFQRSSIITYCYIDNKKYPLRIDSFVEPMAVDCVKKHMTSIDMLKIAIRSFLYCITFQVKMVFKQCLYLIVLVVLCHVS